MQIKQVRTLTKDMKVVELLCLASLVRRTTRVPASVLHFCTVYQQPPAIVENKHLTGVVRDWRFLFEPHNFRYGNTSGRAGEGDGLVDHDLWHRQDIRVLYARRHCTERREYNIE